MEFKTHDPEIEPWMPKKKKLRLGWKPIALAITLALSVGLFFFVNGHPANEALCKKVHGGWFLRNICHNAESS